jgi:hypothetical protein
MNGEVFPCKYCKADVRWLSSGAVGILVNVKKIKVLIPVVKSVNTVVGLDLPLMDEITYKEIDAFQKHWCDHNLPIDKGL